MENSSELARVVSHRKRAHSVHWLSLEKNNKPQTSVNQCTSKEIVQKPTSRISHHSSIIIYVPT